MTTLLPFIIFLVVVAIIIYALNVSQRAAKKRNQLLEEISEDLKVIRENLSNNTNKKQ